jgi:hypothetical protein
MEIEFQPRAFFENAPNVTVVLGLNTARSIDLPAGLNKFYGLSKSVIHGNS